MAKMGKYCKAYPISRFREFIGWSENSENLRKDRFSEVGKEAQSNGQLADDDFLYLQENLIVTDGIFIDENIVFGDVTPEWEAFCKDSLKFQVPVYEQISSTQSQEELAE